MLKRSSWIVGLVITATPLVLFGSLLLSGRVLYWGTPILQFFEWRQLVVDAYRAGHFPLWNDALGCGTPLLANLQSAALYPLNLIYLIFPVEHAMGYSVVIHIILAGFFMYGFARSLGLGKWAGLMAALSYMLSGFLVSRAQFLSMVNAAAWLPLLFWLTGRAMHKRRLSDGILLGLIIAVQLLAGHAQLWYYSLWALGLYALFLGGGPVLTGLRKRNPLSMPDSRQALIGWALVLLALLVGVTAAAGQVFPTAEMTRFSQRAGGADYQFAMNYSFWPWRLFTLVSPDFFGNPANGDYWGYGNYWEDCGYIGLLPLILALASVVLWVRHRRDGKGRVLAQVPFFAILSFAALLLAMGRNLPLYPLIWRYVPGFGFFQAPSRFLYWYTFGMALLAGIGLQFVTSSERWARFARYLIAVSVSVLITAAMGWLLIAGLADLTFLGALTRTAVLAVGAGVLILLGTRLIDGRWRVLWQGSVIGFVVIDLLLFGFPLNPTADPAVYHQRIGSGSFLRQSAENADAPLRLFSFESFTYETMFNRFFRFKSFGSTDHTHLMALRESLLPNVSVIEKLDSANNYDPLVIGTQQDFLDAINELPGPAAAKLLGLMNVQYVVGSPAELNDKPVYSRGVDIFDNRRVLPRAYVVYQARFASGDEGDLAVLAGNEFDPEREILLQETEETDSITISSAPEESVSEVSLRYGANGAKISVVLNRPGYLVLADTYYPGWQAFVNGDEHPILRANHAFRALALSVGESLIEFRYVPQSFRWGMWIGGFTWLGAVALLGMLWLRKRSF